MAAATESWRPTMQLQREDLPPGWTTAISRTTGELYYVNTVTNESTFTHPDDLPIEEEDDFVHPEEFDAQFDDGFDPRSPGPALLTNPSEQVQYSPSAYEGTGYPPPPTRPAPSAQGSHSNAGPNRQKKGGGGGCCASRPN